MTSILPKTFTQKLKSKSFIRDLSMFLNKDGPIWLTIKSLAHDLESHKVDYAIIGGLAVYAHGYERTTTDCDILLSKADYEKFMAKLVNLGLEPKFQGARKKFISNSTPRTMIPDAYPGDGLIGPVSFPDPKVCQENIDNMKFISLPKLIDLKLTSYKRVPAGRIKDCCDVVELIKTLKLKLSFSSLLDPSVRNEFEQLVRDLEKDEQKTNINEE
ncbi:unnamed protein product [Rotaria magnacalcarata]|uniref:Uncharacterized protein n=1 Tax=Rotaria magnacalcarata TaxID=392030 RepID=A0A816XIF4_9BILA|nr:unnamed protein product [Rotaria magnacalcarata]CAF4355630.1 unnamed protein product [Rotaria magnacalcarata]